MKEMNFWSTSIRTLYKSEALNCFLSDFLNTYNIIIIIILCLRRTYCSKIF